MDSKERYSPYTSNISVTDILSVVLLQNEYKMNDIKDAIKYTLEQCASVDRECNTGGWEYVGTEFNRMKCNCVLKTKSMILYNDLMNAKEELGGPDYPRMNMGSCSIKLNSCIICIENFAPSLSEFEDGYIYTVLRGYNREEDISNHVIEALMTGK
jgi:hypothetical protein